MVSRGKKKDRFKESLGWFIPVSIASICLKNKFWWLFLKLFIFSFKFPWAKKFWKHSNCDDPSQGPTSGIGILRQKPNKTGERWKSKFLNWSKIRNSDDLLAEILYLKVIWSITSWISSILQKGQKIGVRTFQSWPTV